MSAGKIIILIVFFAVIVGGYFLTIRISEDMSKLRENSSGSISDKGKAFGDMFIDSAIGDASVLNPLLSTDSASSDINGLIFNGLVKYDKDLRLVGDLAERWEVSENKLTITFYLKKNIKWQDGAPFTSADVEFTYRTLTAAKTKSPYKSAYELVKVFEATDSYTVRVTYAKPFAPALESWGIGIIPKHLLYKEDVNTTDFNSRPTGTGPFIFAGWSRGEKISLRYNEKYFDGRPFIDKFLYRVIPDQSSQLMELKAGGVDSMNLTPDMYKTLMKDISFNAKYNMFKYVGFNYSYMGFNLRNPLFTDKNVRKAIAYGINKKEIIDGVLLGCGVETTGPYLPRSWAYNKSVPAQEYSPEKAKALLTAAGWTSGNDGVLEKNGNKFEFMLLTNQGNKARELMVQIIQQNLKKIGINVKIRVIAWSSLVNEFIDKKKFDAILLGWSLSNDPDNFDLFHSSKTAEKEYNFVSYKNDEVYRLLLSGRTTFDHEKRKQAYNKIHAIMADDLPYVFICVPESLVAVSKRFKGLKVEPAGLKYNFEKWYVPKETQKYRNELQK
jgi:peptide/nickel transport system substrate-binding protein